MFFASLIEVNANKWQYIQQYIHYPSSFTCFFASSQHGRDVHACQSTDLPSNVYKNMNGLWANSLLEFNTVKRDIFNVCNANIPNGLPHKYWWLMCGWSPWFKLHVVRLFRCIFAVKWPPYGIYLHACIILKSVQQKIHLLSQLWFQPKIFNEVLKSVETFAIVIWCFQSVFSWEF